MAPAESPGPLRVEVALAAAPRQVDCATLLLSPGSTVADAVQASGLLARHGLAGLDGLTFAVWGRAAGAGALLRDLDRVELLRPLQVDPKESRRLRYRGQADRQARSGC
jgi:putative ubiquitin-RnfH superfamily antitoxin RatB of RatAB toxin-antitoxin module